MSELIQTERPFSEFEDVENLAYSTLFYYGTFSNGSGTETYRGYMSFVAAERLPSW